MVIHIFIENVITKSAMTQCLFDIYHRVGIDQIHLQQVSVSMTTPQWLTKFGSEKRDQCFSENYFLFFVFCTNCGHQGYPVDRKTSVEQKKRAQWKSDEPQDSPTSHTTDTS